MLFMPSCFQTLNEESKWCLSMLWAGGWSCVGQGYPTKPSRYFKVQLCNHSELHERFTVPGISQERPARAEYFLILDAVLG